MLLKNNYNNYKKCTEAFTTRFYCDYTDDVLFAEYNECTPVNGIPYTANKTRPPIVSRAYALIAVKNVTFGPLSDINNLINDLTNKEIIPGINNIYLIVSVVCVFLFILFKKS